MSFFNTNFDILGQVFQLTYVTHTKIIFVYIAYRHQLYNSSPICLPPIRGSCLPTLLNSYMAIWLMLVKKCGQKWSESLLDGRCKNRFVFWIPRSQNKDDNKTRVPSWPIVNTEWGQQVTISVVTLPFRSCYCSITWPFLAYVQMPICPKFVISENVHTQPGWFCDFKKIDFLKIPLWALVSMLLK